MTYEEIVRNHAGELIGKLVTDVISKEKVEIRFDFEENVQWSVISMYDEEDKEISLRLFANDRYELYFGYYDDKDEFSEITRQLTEEDISMIPKGLQKLMAKVLSDERGMRIPGNLLAK